MAKDSSANTEVTFYKTVAFLEAVSWAGLLFGMYLKHVAETTDKGVSIAGPIHGIMFMCFVVMSVRMWSVRKWPAKTLLLALISSVIPFMTIWFERRAVKHGDI